MFYYPKSMRISYQDVHSQDYGYPEKNAVYYQQVNRYPDSNYNQIDPNQREMNGVPMWPGFGDMNGIPMGPNYRELYGMPMMPDYREMNGMPMMPDDGNMNDMPTDSLDQFNQGNLRDALQMIKDSVQSERKDELFYDDLINMAPNQEQKDIITSIRDDERKHNRYFREIYRDITGETIEADKEEMAYEKPESYLDGIQTALFGELGAVEKYRTIYNSMPAQYYRDILFEIITDELKHSSKYNYLYTTNI